MWNSRTVGIVAAASLLMLLTGCTSAPEPTPTPADVVGFTLEEARDVITVDAVLIYDLSEPVLEQPPTYSDGQPQDEWTVIVQCTADNGFAMGVIPTVDATSEVLAEARDGVYRDLLTECGSG